LRQNTSFLLQTLVHEKKIAIFPRPDQITADHIKIIENKIKSIRPTALSSKANITLSQKAINMIHDCVNFLNKDLH
jgi:lipopolysaccharide biosynthesis protein